MHSLGIIFVNWLVGAIFDFLTPIIQYISGFGICNSLGQCIYMQQRTRVVCPIIHSTCFASQPCWESDSKGTRRNLVLFPRLRYVFSYTETRTRLRKAGLSWCWDPPFTYSNLCIEFISSLETLILLRQGFLIPRLRPTVHATLITIFLFKSKKTM